MKKVKLYPVNRFVLFRRLDGIALYEMKKNTNVDNYPKVMDISEDIYNTTRVINKFGKAYYAIRKEY